MDIPPSLLLSILDLINHITNCKHMVRKYKSRSVSHGDTHTNDPDVRVHKYSEREKIPYNNNGITNPTLFERY